MSNTRLPELIDDNKRSLSARGHISDAVKKLNGYRIVRHILGIKPPCISNTARQVFIDSMIAAPIVTRYDVTLE